MRQGSVQRDREGLIREHHPVLRTLDFCSHQCPAEGMHHSSKAQLRSLSRSCLSCPVCQYSEESRVCTSSSRSPCLENRKGRKEGREKKRKTIYVLYVSRKLLFFLSCDICFMQSSLRLSVQCIYYIQSLQYVLLVLCVYFKLSFTFLFL